MIVRTMRFPTRSVRFLVPALSVCAIAMLATARFGESAAPPHSPTWNAQGAATYLDARMTWWLSWPSASRDHGTTCVSCHTVLPYALARPALATPLGEHDVPVPERRMMENVVKRVQLWRDVDPFYPDQTRGLPKTSESRGTESVLNALILSRRDAAQGALSDDARLALTNMWALQLRTGDQKGAWAWLNFHNEPWEANGSPFFGAALADIAVGSAPNGYSSSADIQDRLGLLRDYLRRNVDTTHLMNRAMALWASGEDAGLFTNPQRQSIIGTLAAAQASDGGWSTAALGSWKRADGTSLDSKSDGYATGLVTLALERSGVPRSDPRVQRGLEWLTSHQDATTGMWSASSLNKSRDPATDIGKFMSDAATAYAVLALTP
jgi:squalene-hopene/tetraprenyl-beta-curcumene cyclase